MKPLKAKNYLAIGFGTILTWLIWQEKPGLNYIIYGAMLIGVQIFQKPEFLKNNLNRIALGGFLFSWFTLFFINSDLSILMYFITLLVYLGAYFQEGIKNVYLLFLSSFFNLFSFLKPEATSSDDEDKHTKTANKYFKLKLFVIPIIITALFIVIYSIANPNFGKYVNTAFDKVYDGFEKFFEVVSFTLILVFIISLLLSLVFLNQRKSEQLEQTEHQQSLIIQRKKGADHFKLLDLLNEYKTALITLFMLNTLILIVNGIDVKEIWMGFAYTPNMDLASELHKGTYLLIISILLSMGVIIYFFRGNINFFKRNIWLKRLSYAWIAQNIILAISVVIRCIQYINYYGIAYKRIGVLLFLSLVFFGLILMFFKIKNQKTSLFLVNRCAWASYALVLLISAIPLDKMIAQYNLNHEYPENIDYSFLMSLSPHAYPILKNNNNRLMIYNDYCHNNYDVFSKYRGRLISSIMEEKLFEIMDQKEAYSWKSFNWADQSMYKSLNLTSHE